MCGMTTIISRMPYFVEHRLRRPRLPASTDVFAHAEPQTLGELGRTIDGRETGIAVW